MKNYPSKLQHDSGVPMTLDPTRLLLVFKNAQTLHEVSTLLQGMGLVLEDKDDRARQKIAGQIEEIVNHTDQCYWVRSENGKPIDQDDFSAIDTALQPALDWIGPVYRLDGAEGRGGLLCPLPNVLLVELLSSLNQESEKYFSEAIARYGLTEVTEKSKYLRGYRYYVLADLRTYTAYQLRDLIQREDRLIKGVYFENMPLLVPIFVVPNDQLFSEQWNMTKIRAGGVGYTGWDISAGNASVVVCMLDTGCDLNHPDITFSTPGINLGSMMPPGTPTWPHGTACAGVAAAKYNNSLGIVGVAGHCQIMPLALEKGTDVEVAVGITFAADNGARVISMSIGHYAPGEVPNSRHVGWNFALIDPAIEYAFNVKGCVLCAATGNDGLDAVIAYPARNRFVIACGASDQDDNRAWFSNFGEHFDFHTNRTTGVSVVAPGVKIPTTDQGGNEGYNNESGVQGDYYLEFAGTSAATPHVAGLAALLFSQYPMLTNKQVRCIIERTADKVGSRPYFDGYPNGSRNQEMGYGRINVLDALEICKPFKVGIRIDADECGVGAVEGRLASFHVRMVELPTTFSCRPHQLNYEWTVSGAETVGHTDQSTISVMMPKTGDEVSLTVMVTDGWGCRASNSTTVIPLPVSLANRLHHFCKMIHLLIVNFMFDPLWDPSRDHPIFESERREIDQVARRLSELLTSRLAGLYEGTRTGKGGRV